MSYPFHMRRRQGEALGQEQNERFVEEKNAQRLDLLAELIHAHVRFRGLEGLGEVERLACDARDALLGAEITDGPHRNDNRRGE